jgi:ATP-dependent exoDNAse (exonuclease V) beta subunit
MIRRFGNEQVTFEHDRLLYVATTRARKNLHLCYELKRNKDGEIVAPRKGSLLRRLWPAIEEECSTLEAGEGTYETRESWVQPRIQRFDSDWNAPAPPLAVRCMKPVRHTEEEALEVTFDWAGSDAMRIGSVVHRCLQYLAETDTRILPAAAVVRSMLTEEGVATDGLATAQAQVQSAIETTLADSAGQWILSAQKEAVSELALSMLSEDRIERLVIDRTFVDEKGDRWIVDYKTSSHEGGGLDKFIDSEVVRYREQLLRYREVMKKLQPGDNIRIALYFPLLSVFREIECDS